MNGQFTPNRPVRIPHKDDRFALSHALDSAIRWRNDCAARLDISLSQCLTRFDSRGRLRERLARGSGQAFVAMRDELFYAMKEPMPNGLVLSFPEVAAACGLTSHSTVVDAVHRVKARRRAERFASESNTGRHEDAGKAA